MSSGNESHESIQFIPEKSDLNAKIVDIIPNEQENHLKNEENIAETPKDACCCRQFFRLIRRMQNIYTWKIPWIIILISVIQVILIHIFCSNIYCKHNDCR